MLIGMLGEKIGMMQIFTEKGNVIPVTLLQIGPCSITQIKRNKSINPYASIQIGYKYINPKQLNKAQLGHFKTIKSPCFKYLKEYKSKHWHHLNIGEIVNIDQLKIGNSINASGLTIGKGFSGYQKKYNFKGGPMSHGSKHHKTPGSIGAGTTPGRVFPGKKMAGRMGHTKVTIKNLKIISVNIEKNLLLIKGSIPGKKGNLIYINQ
uniref:Large ribosomal subunit protein uL3c n=1 Tax=Harveyella mirabilis TaxID=282355 RepID=A0A3S8UW11_9FLOR|nr:ribosomal protein L3 [Harveyella mirabilis]